MDDLTKRQRQILRFIEKMVDKEGFPPTRQEIANHFGFQVNAATDHLEAIERKGYIQIVPRISRGIRVLYI